jgi:hypothetical protein
MKMSSVISADRKVITVEKIGFSDIAPTWNKRLAKLPVSFLTKMRWFLDLHSKDVCIVGEAHGFNSRYVHECDVCDKFSLDFEFHFMKNQFRELEITKEQFVEHWNTNHKDVDISLIGHRRMLRWYHTFLRFDDYVWTIK